MAIENAIWHPDMPEEYKNAIVTGDARELATRIPDESIALVLTDPPFGIGYDEWDIYSGDEYLIFLESIIKEANRILIPGGLAFVFQATPKLRETWLLFPEHSRLFIAAKNFVQMCGWVPFAYDPVIFWYKGEKPRPTGRARDWHVGNTANTMNRKDAEAGWHSCPRPLDTIRYMVNGFSNPKDVVVDFFAGSGTLPLACKQLNRNYIAFEIDPDTAELARERLRNTQSPLFVMEPEPEQLDLLQEKS